MKWFAVRSRQGSEPRRKPPDEQGAILGAFGLILLLTSILLGTSLVGELHVGAQAGAVVFMSAWSAYALYAASADGAAQGRLLSHKNWLKFAAPIVAAFGVLWLTSGR